MKLTDLQMSIGQHVARGLDAATLELIYEKLMEIDDEKGGTIPVTAKIVFGIDDAGILTYDLTIKSAIPVFKTIVRLKSDGRQMKLWGSDIGAAPAAPSPAETAPAPDPPKKASKPAAKKKRAAKPKRKMPKQSAEVRRNEIVAGNQRLYLDNLITREQAIEGGVDVEALDETPEPVVDEMDLTQASSSINALTDDELLGLKEMS